jgi:hypothetical protein
MPPVGFESHNLNRRAAVDLRLRSHGHWDRQNISPLPAEIDDGYLNNTTIFLDTQGGGGGGGGGGDIALEANHDDPKCFMFVYDKDMVM